MQWKTFLFCIFTLVTLTRNVTANTVSKCDHDDSSTWLELFTKLNKILAESRDLSFGMKNLKELIMDTNSPDVMPQMKSLNRTILGMGKNITAQSRDLNRTILRTQEDVTLQVKSLNQTILNVGNDVTLEVKNLRQLMEDSQRDARQEIKSLTQKVGELEMLLKQQNGEFCFGGNWTVIQRRGSGSEDFYRTWKEYKEGFGSHTYDFWLGLENLHRLTNDGKRYELMVIMEDFENDRRHAIYDDFQIDSEVEKYALKKLGQYSGTAGEALFHHLGQKFSTKDQDNDQRSDGNCAVIYPGGWWHKNCFHSHLNGVYQTQGDVKAKSASGIHWLTFRGHGFSLKFVQMMIRPHVSN